MSDAPIIPIAALIHDILDESLSAGRDITHPEWHTFWSLAVMEAATFQLTCTTRDLHDVCDRVWISLLTAQRPEKPLRDLHRLLLITAGVPEDEELNSILVFFGDHIALPPLTDWKANLALISSVNELRNGFEKADMPKIRATMERYVDLLAPDFPSSSTDRH